MVQKVMIRGLATPESGGYDGRFNRTPNPFDSLKHGRDGGEVRITTLNGQDPYYCS
jgi:hypothetical protein